jgi:hypothetical protein
LTRNDNEANKLEKRYSPLLKKGIKLTIGLKEIKQREKQIGLTLRVVIKPNTTEKEYKIFHKEGVLKNPPLDDLIEKALENLTDEFYQGKSDEDEKLLSRGIQRTIANIQRDYARATKGKDNVITVGGNKFFIDQARNYYVYPDTDAQRSGIIIDNKGKITTTKSVTGYEYNRFSNVTLGSLLNLLTNIHANRSTELRRTAMLIASLAAEPFRYGPSHITNLIALNNYYNYSDSDDSAFSVMAMTTGGTDPRSSKNVLKDPNRKGTVPNEVRKRQIEIVKNDSTLYNRLNNYYYKNASKMKESEIIKKFKILSGIT